MVVLNTYSFQFQIFFFVIFSFGRILSEMNVANITSVLLLENACGLPHETCPEPLNFSSKHMLA